MARGPLPLPVSLDPAAPLTLHVQLREGLRTAILDRRLPRGARLPASRVLAADLGCARGTVVLAPMVRSGELPSRLLALKYGADLVWGESLAGA